MTTVRAGEAREITVGFEQGTPVSLDGRALPLHELIVELNDVVGAYGWGRLDMVENRRVGHQEPRDLRGAGRPGPDHGPRRPGEHLPGA